MTCCGTQSVFKHKKRAIICMLIPSFLLVPVAYPYTCVHKTTYMHTRFALLTMDMHAYSQFLAHLLGVSKSIFAALVCVCMYVCMHACMPYVCTYTHTYVHVCLHVWSFTCTSPSLPRSYVYVCVCMYMHG
jgi:hypothetical protein